MIALTHVDAVLVAIASLVLTACVPIVTGYLLKHLGIATKSALGNDIYNAVQAGAQVALHELESVAAHNQSLSIRNEAIASGVKEVLALAPVAFRDLNLTTDKIAAYISGEVAKVLDMPEADAPSAPMPAPAPTATTPAASVSQS